MNINNIVLPSILLAFLSLVPISADAGTEEIITINGVQFLHTDEQRLAKSKEYPRFANAQQVQRNIPINFDLRYPGFEAFKVRMRYNIHDAPGVPVGGYNVTLKHKTESKRMFYVGINAYVRKGDFVENSIANEMYSVGLYMLLEREGVDTMKLHLQETKFDWEGKQYTLMHLSELVGDAGSLIDAGSVMTKRYKSFVKYLNAIAEHNGLRGGYALSTRVFDQQCERELGCFKKNNWPNIAKVH